MKLSRGEKAFSWVNSLVLLVYTVIVVFPFWYVICASLTDYSVFSSSGGIVLFPKKVNLEYYNYILRSGRVFINTYINTIFNTVVGTVFAMLMTIGAAYGLAEKKLPGRKLIMMYFIITMFFSGGMIPTYITVKKLGLLDTRLTVVLIMGFMTYNMIIMKSFFESIPASLKESARLDGASEFRILIQIVVPVSRPAIATIALFYGVAYWNDFFTAMMYSPKIDYQPVQLLLRNIIAQGNLPPEVMQETLEIAPPMIGVQMASVVLVALPLVLVYPFVQKYFEKGIMLGAVKG